MNLQPFSKCLITYFGLCILLTALFLIIYVRSLLNPPTAFVGQQQFEITEGMSVRDIAQEAHVQGLVRSELFLYALLTYSHDPTRIFAGTYIFTEPVTVFGVAEKLAANDIENNLVRLTIPEGVSLQKTAEIAEVVLPFFHTDEYLVLTGGLEGMLFPETYFVPEDFTAADLVELQQTTYEENVAPLRQKITASGFSEREVVTLASIIEREANDEASMKMVSGIFQNRLEIGMPLQADATIEYELGVPLGELPEGQLASELRETQSPYNTYLNTGLTPTPIGNPGLMAITAVLEPTPSEYLYYITGNDGEFYYAQTLQGHNANINSYLR